MDCLLKRGFLLSKSRAGISGSTTDYGEARLVTLGKGRSKILVVVSTVRENDAMHIISVRKASGDETNWYYFGRP
jgi:uncharacterized DUF497 family protein